MCGITGILSWTEPPDRDLLQRMNDRLHHRGPDAEGIVIRGPMALGHRRLSIIDVTDASNQPLPDHTGQYWIVFNGEIYNYQELRKELVSAGAEFVTSSDTEVILEAYKGWGVRCLEHLNGMFAFALWDEPRQRLLVARDRTGEKPLYYQVLPDGGIAFASELKALRLHPAVSKQINARALGQYLSLNYVLTSACILEGVEKLPAAHYLLVERGRPPRPTRYWDLAPHFRDKGRFRSEAEATEALAMLLEDAVSLRLVSDVPLGAFLSGGIDSSAIVAAMSRLGEPSAVKTFSIGFEEESYNELAAARSTARFLGVDHHDQMVRADMAAALPRIVEAADEPFADTSVIPVYYLAEFTRQQVTVSLSGDGSDEIFAGYETYTADRLLHATRWAPPYVSRAGLRAVQKCWPVSFDCVSLDYKVRQFLRGHSLGAQRAHYFWRVIFDDAAKRQLVRPEWRAALLTDDPFDEFGRYYAEVADCHYLDQAMYVDIKTWLVDDILVKVDRATMAHSLEARAPFLDHRLIELAAALPAAWKLKGLQKKYLLRQTQRRHLPHSVVDRRKHGFNSPVSEWFTGRGPLAELAESVTTDGTLGEWFDGAAIKALWHNHRAKTEDNGLKLLGLTCLGLWLRQ